VNARIALDVLNGAEGPRRDAVLLNAAAAICAGGLADDIAGGIPIAQRSIDSGRALEKLEQLKAMSNAG
jgi:anthranilate phosphoribosyltransferase